MQDRYGLELSTKSETARDAYVDGVDRLLSGDAGAEHAFQAALDADADFALAGAALARAQQFLGDGRAARDKMAAALQMPAPETERERSHMNAMDLMIRGKMPEGYVAIRDHLLEHPRDAVLAQSCTGVFGLIGFSGLAGREAEQLAFTTSLAHHYGDDWWFLGQHAFSQVEAGQIHSADVSIDRALAGNPRSAHNIHIRAHVDYESGGTEAGLSRLIDWIPGLERQAIMHCHINWHIALWSLAVGDIDGMWRVYDDAVAPDATWGPSINVITDSAALLYRAQLAGIDVSAERWQRVGDYAATTFPRTGIAFVDAHAALAYAMCGDRDGLDRVIEGARGPAGDVVRSMARGFGSMAAGQYADAVTELGGVMSDHERIGGSRAQRDLIEFAVAEGLRQQGKSDEARRMLSMHRPVHNGQTVVAGL